MKRHTNIFRWILPALLLIVVGAAGQTHLARGNRAYRDGDFPAAIAAYRAAVAENENPALAWFNLGNAQYQNGAPQHAVASWERAVLEAPGFGRGWLNLGVLYYELGDLGAAVAVLTRAEEILGDEVTVLALLGTAYKDLEQFGTAAVHLEWALEKDSTLSDATLMLYEMFWRMGDVREALRWLERYPAQGPRRYDAVLLAGEARQALSDTAGALMLFRQATALAPERMRGWMALVEHLNQMGTPYTALLEARRVLERNPGFTPLALQAGRIGFTASYYDQAQHFFTHAAAAGHPDGLVGVGNLIAVYSRLGEDAAVERLRRQTGH